MKKIALLLMALLTGLLNASAGTNFNLYGWYQMGEANGLTQAYLYDSTTNRNTFASGFDNSAPYFGDSACVTNIAVGGPLGPSNYTSTVSAKQRFQPNNNGGYWKLCSQFSTDGVSYNQFGQVGAGPDVPGANWSFHTNKNWVVEGWILPVGSGTRDGGAFNASIFELLGSGAPAPTAATTASTTNGGIQLWGLPGGITNNASGTTGAFDGTFYVQCWCVGPQDTNINGVTGQPDYLDKNGLPWNYQLGSNILVKTATSNSWTHLAVVRDDVAQTLTFYVNGVAVAQTNAQRMWQPSILDPSQGGPLLGYYTNARPYFGNSGNSGDRTYLANGNGIPDGIAGQGQSGNRQFSGYYDEWRLWSFDNTNAATAFSTNNLLLRSIPGPGIVQQPKDVSVYSGGAAAFQVLLAFDTANTYQWYQVVGSTLTAITAPGVVTTNFNLILPTPGNGNKYVCLVANGSGSRYTTTNTVTVVSNPSSIQASYHSAVTTESSLISYWPGDTDSAAGTTLTDVKGLANGTISGNAGLDGNTNTFSFGQGLVFNRQGEWQFGVQDQVQIPNNGAYDFDSGFGTIEAVLYLDPAAAVNPSLFSFPAQNNGFSWLCTANFTNTQNKNFGYTEPNTVLVTANYVCSADAIGHLVFWAPYFDGTNPQDSVPLSWSVPGGTLGRVLHVAYTFDHGSNVTCYVNGQNLGTQSPVGLFASTNGANAVNLFGQTNMFCMGYTNLPLTIGSSTYGPTCNNGATFAELFNPSSGLTNEGYYPAQWYGTIDEVAMYSTNLPASTIASHAFKYFNGGSSQPASVVNLTPSKSMYANGTETFNVLASGQPPYTYAWYTNSTTNSLGSVVGGATSPSLTLSNIQDSVSVQCVVQGAVGSPATSAPVFINITIPAPGTYAAQVMSNAPVAYYRFNENGGSAVFDWAGSHDGTYSAPNSYSNNAPGPVMSEVAVHFLPTITGTVVGQVTVPSAPELMCNASNNGQFSYEFWAKADNTNSDQCPLSGRFRGGENKAGIMFLYYNDGLITEKDAVGFGGNGAPNYGIEMQSGRYGNVNQYNRSAQTPYAQNFPTNIWHHVVGTWTTNGTIAGAGGSAFNYQGFFSLYLDGNLIASNNTMFNPLTVGGAGGNFQANHNFSDLIIGNNTFGETGPTYKSWFGSIADVAIYTYPLTKAQVQNHYSAYYTPATNVAGPTGTTINESYTNSILLTASVSGAPNTYQWYRVNGGVSNALSGAVLNADGSLHYPAIFNGVSDSQGVDAPTLLITQVTPADDGTYVLVTSNFLNTTTSGYIVSSGAIVTVTPDTTPPVITATAGLGEYIGGTPSTGGPGAIQIRFSKRMDVTSCQNAANYSVSGGVTVQQAYLSASPVATGFGGDERIVTLLTSTLTPGQTYNVTVSGVRDDTYELNPLATVTKSFTAPTLKPGLTWDFFPNIQTLNTLVGGLTGGQYFGTIFEFQANNGVFTQVPTNTFPFVPEDEQTLANFTTYSLYDGGTSLGSNPIYGTGPGTGLDLNFGALISGWITPTRSDNYTFFLQCDDQASLYLSTDNTPGNALMIAQGYGVQTAYYEPGAPQANNATSAPYSLTAGQHYFVQVLHSQLGGFSYASVAWRSQTGPDASTPAGNLSAISGQYLTAYSQAEPLMSINQAAGQAVINWTGYGHLVESSSLSVPISQWTPVAGNPTSPTTVSASVGKVYYAIVK